MWVRFAGQTAGYTSHLYWSSSVGALTQFIFNNHASPIGTEYKIPHTFAAGDEVLFTLYVTDTGDKFSSGPGSRNADGLAHSLVHTSLTDPKYDVEGGFEDLSRGGDRDYDDLLFDFGGVPAAPVTGSVVPEPVSLALLGAGLAGLALVRRRRRSASRRADHRRLRRAASTRVEAARSLSPREVVASILPPPGPANRSRVHPGPTGWAAHHFHDRYAAPGRLADAPSPSCSEHCSAPAAPGRPGSRYRAERSRRRRGPPRRR